MQKNLAKLSVLIMIFFLTIGFAAVTLSLSVDGSVVIDNNEDFKLDFVSVNLNGVDVTDLSLVPEEKLIRLTLDENLNSEQLDIDYVLKNDSTKYDVKVTVLCRIFSSEEDVIVNDSNVLNVYSGKSKSNNVIINNNKTDNQILECKYNLVGIDNKKKRVAKVLSGDGTKLGDEIAIGDQEFYVISNENSQVKMLAKYNLMVGNKCTTSSSCSVIADSTGLQDSTMKGYDKNGYPYLGVVQFSSYSNKGEEYSSYVGSIVEGYVNNYINYLKTKYEIDIQGGLLTKKEVEAITGNTSSYSYYFDNSVPAWLYSTSTWLDSPYSSSSIWTISTNKYFTYYSYSYNNRYGVRPMIIMSEGYIE